MIIILQFRREEYLGLFLNFLNFHNSRQFKYNIDKTYEIFAISFTAPKFHQETERQNQTVQSSFMFTNRKNICSFILQIFWGTFSNNSSSTINLIWLKFYFLFRLPLDLIPLSFPSPSKAIFLYILLLLLFHLLPPPHSHPFPSLSFVTVPNYLHIWFNS